MILSDVKTEITLPSHKVEIIGSSRNRKGCTIKQIALSPRVDIQETLLSKYGRHYLVDM